MQYTNPIIPGFNPDPSVCRVGDDFYLVTSSFEFFPGVPIYHSKNLVNWELIGHCLSTDEQLPLQGCPESGGIYAPTIRYHDGMFFMTTTNVSHGGNFIVHTTDIRGRWSSPVWVKQGGIDPSLFWDEDGSCYFVSNGSDKGEGGRIFLCEIDPFTGEMQTESKLISDGCGGKYPEAPHIYKRNGWYYLMLAEGGTEYGHMETLQRARNIYGPYEPCPHNPILSHCGNCRDPLSTAIQATGHADIVEDQNGNWWLVCLGIRPIGAMLHNLGRETFLSPMHWTEDDWMLVGDHGRISLQMDGPLPGGEPEAVKHDFEDHFDGKTLDLRWNFVRNPQRERYALENSRFIINGGSTTLSTVQGHPAFAAVRQPEFCIEAATCMEGNIVPGQRSGLTAYYNDSAHYEIFLTRKTDGHYICLSKRVGDIEIVTAAQKIDYKGTVYLSLKTDRQWYTFYYRTGAEWRELGKGMTAFLCTEAIQNACDQIDIAIKQGLLRKEEAVVDIWIDVQGRTISVEDNATGVRADEFVESLGDVANSSKIQGENKGFRGIGRLIGLAYCKTLKFTTSFKGESVASVMICDAQKMRRMIGEKQRYNVDEFWRLLWMPEEFIIYRRKYDAELRERLADRYKDRSADDCDLATEWWEKFNRLPPEKLEQLKSIVALNKFGDGDFECSDSDILEVLAYYRIGSK